MCGIAGWVDFARPVGTEQAAVRAMTATMALRGPDAEGVWTDEHVALGHRRLAVIDPPGGAQPMVFEADGRTIAALTYSGEVYNYRELRDELRAKNHVFRTESDSEVVLHAYVEWGEGFLERLNGMFAFAIWDPRRQRLLLARDRMGIKPLHWYRTPDGILFGSEPKAILAHPFADAVVDADGLRELFSMARTPGRTIYRGLNSVKPGHVVAVDANGAREYPYWTLEAREHTDDLRTTVGTIRDLLDDIVSRQLISDVPLCTLLSGGLDSSAITVLAAKQLGEKRISSFAVDFVGQTENFVPDPMRDTPDAPFVHDVAKHIAANHQDIVLDTGQLMDPLFRLGVLAANDAPNPMGDMYTSLYLLFRAVRERSTVALSGESADEVFGGYRWFHDPAVIAQPDFPWTAQFRLAEPDAPAADDILDPDLARTLDLETFQRDAYATAIAEVGHVARESEQEHRMREVSYLHLTRFVQMLLDRKDRMSMAHGLEVRVPFCDHRLVEYVYNTPWAMKTFDGHEKSLLRAAVADVLPKSVLERRKSPYPATQDTSYGRELTRRVADVVSEPHPTLSATLNTKRVSDYVAQGASTDGFANSRRVLETVLGLEEWLDRTPVRVRV